MSSDFQPPIQAELSIRLTGARWGEVIGDIEQQKDLVDFVDTKLSALGSNVEADIAALDDKIENEILNIQDDINSLAQTVSDNYTDLDNKISDEADFRIEADNALQGNIGTLDNKIDAHIADKSNPHEVTKAQVGLGNVDNTSDLNKPISNATQTALDGLDNKINANTGLIEDLEVRLSALVTEVDDNYIDLDNKISSTNTNLANLSQTVTNNKTSTDNAINTLSNTVSNNYTELNTKITTNTNNLSNLQTTVTNNYNTLDGRITSEVSTLNNSISDEADARIAADNLINSDIDDIQDLIPNQASSSNQLADKQYVNSAIQTNSAHFRGRWLTWANVPTDANDYPEDDDGIKTPTTNDYMVVQNASDYTGETLEGAWQFTYTGLWSTNGKAGWQPRFQINESPLTPSQQAALDSGITSSLVDQISTNQTNISNLQSTKQDNISDLSTIRQNAQNGQNAYTTIQGYGNIVTHNVNEFATAEQGTKADTALQQGDDISLLNNDVGYITGIGSSDVITALGYTPYNSTNPNGYQANVIETIKVNNIALTPASKVVNITVPTNNNQLTNGAGYITSSAIANMQTTTNLVTSVSSSSTDSQYPSAKLFYDTCGDIETLINAL